MSKKRFAVFICLILFLNIACIVESFGKGKIPPIVVSVSKVKQIKWQQTVEATGSLSSMEGIVIKSEAAGRATKIHFKSGQHIKAGEPILQIYSDVYKAQLRQAKAKLQLDRNNYKRCLELYGKHFLSKAALDKAETAVASSKATVDRIEAQLNQTLISAPFHGRLGLRLVSLGEYLVPGKPIVELQAIDPIRVDFSVPEVYLNQLKVGNIFTATSQALIGKPYEGKIYAINTSVDVNTRNISVRGSIPNHNHILIPGMFIQVKLKLGKSEAAVVVQQTAIVYTTDKNYVYRMINHRAILTPVILGSQLNDNRIVITKGLKSGDVVIKAGSIKLSNMAPVMTAKEAAKRLISKMKKG